MRNRYSRRHLWVLLAVVGLVALLARIPNVPSGFEYARVEYHYYGFRNGGGMAVTAPHKNALVELALQGNEHALKRYLESVRFVDGANSYWHFNDLVTLLRQVDDARMARAFITLDPYQKVRHHHYLSYITDLETLRPLTYAAAEMTSASKESLDPELAYPLFDQRQVWP